MGTELHERIQRAFEGNAAPVTAEEARLKAAESRHRRSPVALGGGAARPRWLRLGVAGAALAVSLAVVLLVASVLGSGGGARSHRLPSRPTGTTTNPLERIGTVRVPPGGAIAGLALASNHLWIAVSGRSSPCWQPTSAACLEGRPIARPTLGRLEIVDLSDHSVHTESTGTMPSVSGNGRYVWVASEPTQPGQANVPPSPPLRALGGNRVVQYEAATGRAVFTYSVEDPMEVVARGSTAWVLGASAPGATTSELVQLRGGRARVLATGIFGYPVVAPSLVWCGGRIATLTMRSGAGYAELSTIPADGGRLEARTLRLPGAPLLTCAGTHLLVTSGSPASSAKGAGTYALAADGMAGPLPRPFGPGAFAASTAGDVLWLADRRGVVAYDLRTDEPIGGVARLPLPSSEAGLLGGPSGAVYVVDGSAVMRLAR